MPLTLRKSLNSFGRLWTTLDPLELPIFAQAVPGYMDVAVVLLLDLPKCRKPVLEISKGWSCD